MLFKLGCTVVVAVVAVVAVVVVVVVVVGNLVSQCGVIYTRARCDSFHSTSIMSLRFE